MLDLGLSREEIIGRLRRGRLHRLYPGVYAVGHKVLTQRSRWMAAVLACGPNAVLSHWSAAALWGIRANRGGQTVESVLRQCEYLRLYDPLSLGDLVGRYPGHRGVRAARTALARLEESTGETEEGLEERFLAFVDRYELPRPDFNPWLEVQGQRYKVDCLWPAQRLIAELDSWQAHGTRSAFRSDKPAIAACCAVATGPPASPGPS